MPKFSRAALLAATGLAAAALATGCGSSGSHPSGSSTTTPTAPSSPSAPASPTSPAAKPALETASSSLGTIVTNGDGFTLYRFDHDTNNPSMSNCTGSCNTLWPPALETGNTQVKGIDSKLVGTITLADGSKQFTLNGWPLYHYAPDTKPGDTKGQGFGGIWFASTPTGGKAAAPAPSSPSGGGGGYGY